MRNARRQHLSLGVFVLFRARRSCFVVCAAAQRVALTTEVGYNADIVSLAEIKSAVDALSPEELAELATFIRERDQAAWNRQIDDDFAEGGRLTSVAEEVRGDIRAGRLQDLP